MTHCITFAVVVLATLLPVGKMAAEEDNTGSGNEGASGVQASGAAKSEFQRKYLAWRNILEEIELLRVEYQTAGARRQKELQNELQTKFKAAGDMVPGIIESAVAAFEATGGEDKELTDFLVAVAWHQITSDRYEAALKVVEPLVAKGVEQRGLAMSGGVAAFSLTDYDAARKYFAEAEAAGDFAEPPEAINEAAMQIWQLAVGFREIIDEHERAWQREQAIRAEEAAADDLPRVRLRTTKGDIVVELFENEAPNTAKNFVTLVEEGLYDGTAFHRVLPNFMAQGGDPMTAGKPPLNYTIPCECFQPDARQHFRGSLSMAHGGRDTGSSQFFLTFRPTPHLDGKTFYPDSPADTHTVFGRVIEGMELLADLNRIDPAAQQRGQADRPEPDRILDAKVLRKRPGTDYGDFTKLAE